MRQIQKFLWNVFNGKKVIVTQVSDGISKADELIAKALGGNVPIFTAKESEEGVSAKSDNKRGHRSQNL